MSRFNHPSPYYPVGTRVRSHYHATWSGVIVDIRERGDGRNDDKGQWIAECLITHDRNGNPVRKPFRSMLLHTHYLEVLPDEINESA